MSGRNDQFSGIRLKRTRAWDQINGLKPEIIAFLDTDPYVPRIHFEGHSGTLTLSIHVERAPDPMWGVRIGEIIHNLRSALDHLVWELVILNTGKPPVKDNKNQFPIFEAEVGFNSRGISTCLKDVGQNAIGLIRAEQPFPQSGGGTGEGGKSPLWHLHELSNADKHRTLHLTGTTLTSFKADFAPIKFAARTVDVEKRSAGPIQENAILQRTRFIHDTEPRPITEWPFTSREVKTNLAVDVAFDQRTPAVGGWLVFPTLVHIANRTDRILARIAEDIFKVTL